MLNILHHKYEQPSRIKFCLLFRAFWIQGSLRREDESWVPAAMGGWNQVIHQFFQPSILAINHFEPYQYEFM